MKKVIVILIFLFMLSVVNAEISLNVEWDEDEIINGREFNIEISASNLEENTYDFKIWIEEDKAVISDRYDTENKVWKSGKYYVNEFLKGPGDKKEEIKLRIRKDYADFEGKTKLFFKIRDGERFEKDIEILKGRSDDSNHVVESKSLILDNVENNENFDESKEVDKVIFLKPTQSLSTKITNPQDFIIYESKNEKIKIYSIYSFLVLCFVIVILVLFKKLE